MELNFYRFNEYMDLTAEPGETIGMSGLVRAGEHDAEFVQVPYTTWGDYVGSVAERSNAQALWEQFQGILVRARGDYGSEFLLMPLLPVSEEDAETYEYLMEIVEGLDNYPLFDEDLYYEIEQELIQEAIPSYLVPDLRREFPDLEDEAITALVYKYLEDGTHSPYSEDAVGSVVFPDIEAWIKEHLAHTA